MKVILCGYHWAGCKALDLLLANGYDVFVYTHESPYHIPSVKDMCIHRNIRYSIDDISEIGLPFVPDIICSIYYRNIIKKKIIDSCNGKIFNLHPSLLPKYRGCGSVTWAIINGEKETGFSYHYIDEGCDTGNILLQQKVKIGEWDTQETLYYRVQYIAMEYFYEAFSLVMSGKPGSLQTGEVSYYKRGCPYGGEINPTWDLSYTERFIRAMTYPPYPSARYNGIEIFSTHEYQSILCKSS